VALRINLVTDEYRYPLADIELTAMDALRSLAQKHLDEIGQSLTAAAFDPLALITDQMEAEYLALAVSLWEQLDEISTGFGLDLLPMSTFYPLVADTIQRSRNYYVEALKTILNKQDNGVNVLGEFFLVPDYVPGTGLKPPSAFMVQFGDIRSVLSALGGQAGGEVPLSTGITGGETFREILSANGIGGPDKLWLYGETIRRTFNGHLQMDGLVFSDWNDEALNISPQDRWLRVPKYRPGDHWGCACVVVPYIPNFGEGVPMTITASGFNSRQPRDKDGQWTSYSAGMTSLDRERIDAAWGNGTRGLFGNSMTTTPVPWPVYPRNKKSRGPIYDQDAVSAALRNPRPEPVDPRFLFATQPNLVRQHVDFYFDGPGRGTGKLAADQDRASNRYPIVYVDRAGRQVLLTGHHRAAAALAHGEDLEALVVRAPSGD